jgi:MFS family permease
MDGRHVSVDSEAEPQRAFLITLVALTFVMNLLARGVPETFAVFLLPVQSGLGLSRPEITLTYSCYMLAYGLSAPFAGQLIDRLGARVTYGFGLASLGLGYLIAGSATGLWPYLTGVGLLGGLGAASLGMIVASGLLSRWFTANIGSIMSLPYAALGAGMLILPPLAQLLLASYGWRTAHHVIGAGVLAVLPLTMLLPLGRMTAGAIDWQELRRRSAAGAAGRWTVTAAVRTSGFWGLFAAYLFTSIAAYAVLPHSVAFLVERGFDPLVAASAFGTTGMLSVLGLLGVGWLSDRIGRRRAATLSYLSTIMGILALISVSVWPSLLLVYAFVCFFGLMQGARGPIIVALTARLFPGGGVGAIYGTLSMGMGGGAAIGSWVSGLLYQLTGGYVASFTLSAASAFIGMASFWAFRSLREEVAVAASAAIPEAEPVGWVERSETQQRP